MGDMAAAAMSDMAAATRWMDAVEQAALVEEYETRFANPYVAAERGYVDDVIPASETRRVLGSALRRLVYKREPMHSRRHANTPL